MALNLSMFYVSRFKTSQFHDIHVTSLLGTRHSSDFRRNSAEDSIAGRASVAGVRAPMIP
eukprot:1345030-Amorphochlora_amoeboformis.AAC.1